MVTPTIAFEPDGYSVEGFQLMGRRAAGNAFLRAAATANAGRSLTCYTANPASARSFATMVGGFASDVEPRWIRAPGLGDLAAAGGLYLPDPRLAQAARLRLRARPDAWFLCGVTHTLSSALAVGMLADLVAGPVMPWDALICTSAAARSAVEEVMGEQARYLAWRIGGQLTVPRPLTPVIPLGVHAADHDRPPEERAAARAQLGLTDGEIAFLFAGRLSFHGKAHPFEMLCGLQATAERTGVAVTLILAGQFYNQAIGDAYRSALASFAPDVRAVIVDGADAEAYEAAWAAADVFVSLADSVQETFGITPVEAMAAGLPVVVSDWDGYRDTVRDGIDGFRIATWAPAPGSGAPGAVMHEAEAMTFDQQASWSSTAVSVDKAALVDRLAALATDADLRARLGASGRKRANADYDWRVVFARYEALWAEQAAIRGRAAADPTVAAHLAQAPRDAAPHRDQTSIFSGYPTHHLRGETLVSATTGATAVRYADVTSHTTLNRWNPPAALVEHWLGALGDGPLPVATLAAGTRIDTGTAIDAIARLAKLGLVRLG